jgi:hypothetical protein
MTIRRLEKMRAIWQFILKHEFWVLMAVWVGLLIAYKISGDALLPGMMLLIFIVAITRLAGHPMWRKGEQAED